MALSRVSTCLSRVPHYLSSTYGASRKTSTLANFKEILGAEVAAIRAAGTYKHERVITTPQAAKIRVQEREGSLLNFCANNYLGLSVSYLCTLTLTAMIACSCLTYVHVLRPLDATQPYISMFSNLLTRLNDPYQFSNWSTEGSTVHVFVTEK